VSPAKTMLAASSLRGGCPHTITVPNWRRSICTRPPTTARRRATRRARAAYGEGGRGARGEQGAMPQGAQSRRACALVHMSSLRRGGVAVRTLGALLSGVPRLGYECSASIGVTSGHTRVGMVTCTSHGPRMWRGDRVRGGLSAFGWMTMMNDAGCGDGQAWRPAPPQGTVARWFTHTGARPGCAPRASPPPPSLRAEACRWPPPGRCCVDPSGCVRACVFPVTSPVGAYALRPSSNVWEMLSHRPAHPACKATQPCLRRLQHASTQVQARRECASVQPRGSARPPPPLPACQGQPPALYTPQGSARLAELRGGRVRAQPAAASWAARVVSRSGGVCRWPLPRAPALPCALAHMRYCAPRLLHSTTPAVATLQPGAHLEPPRCTSAGSGSRGARANVDAGDVRRRESCVAGWHAWRRTAHGVGHPRWPCWG
jgi:hypothetical protein